MAYFQTKNPFYIFRVLQWKMLVYFMAIRPYLSPFGTFCGHFPRFGMLKNLATMVYLDSNIGSVSSGPQIG
jgi:hypothetical protein